MERGSVIGLGVSLALLLVVLAVSVPASASSAAIPAGGSYTYKIPAIRGDNITFTWSTDEIVVLVVYAPDGSVAFSGGAGSGERPNTLDVSELSTGEWTFKWFNGDESSAKLTFHVTSTTVDTIRAPLVSEIRLVLAILVVLVIVVAVLIALVALLIRRPKPPLP